MNVKVQLRNGWCYDPKLTDGMECPECGYKTNIVKSVYNSDSNELYRKRRCAGCDSLFYTVEFEVELTEQIKELLNKER